MTFDPFGAASIRGATLRAWGESALRLRQDANLEEDFARGYYASRAVVELAQNASDAAGEAGRLRLSLLEGENGFELHAANTGQPLTTAGVEALAGLRASAKRGAATVGHFGVGFAALRALSDDIAIISTTGAVAFSLERTHEALTGMRDDRIAALVAERGRWLPILRLPWNEAAPATLPKGFTTLVRARLRDGEAVEEARRQLEELDDLIVLSLPGLARVLIEVPGRTRTIDSPRERFTVVSRTGEIDPDVLADRPVEEQRRTEWSVTWALPREGTLPAHQRFIHAPTPTHDRLELAAALIATLPLDPTRRQVATGPLTDLLLEQAAGAYADLARVSGVDALRLVPVHLPASRLDGELSAAILRELAEVPVRGHVQAREAQMLPDSLYRVAPLVAAGVVEAASACLPELIDVPLDLRAPAKTLGIEEISLAEVADAATRLDRAGLERLYAALEPLISAGVPHLDEDLATLPVPLVGGKVRRGARGTLLTSAVVPSGWGAVVDPQVGGAFAELLLFLGAQRTELSELLASPEATAQVEDDPAAAQWLLPLVGQALAEGSTGPWLGLGDVLLVDEEGQQAPAADLTVPGTPAAATFDPEKVGSVHPDLVAQWGSEVLRAVGAHADVEALTIAQAHEWADGLDDYRVWADLDPDEPVEVLTALDIVAPQAWPQVLASVLERPNTRRALLGDGRGTSYAAWWLTHRGPAWLGGAFALPSAQLLAGLGIAARPRELQGVDNPQVLRALGGIGGLDELDAAGWTGLLIHPVLPNSPADAAAAAGLLWRSLPDAAARVELVRPPEQVVALEAGEASVAAADRCVVADNAMWLQRTDLGPLLPAREETCEAIADLLDVPLASEVCAGTVDCAGRPRPLSPALTVWWPRCPAHWQFHEELTVDGATVRWWVSDGEIHAVDEVGAALAVGHLLGKSMVTNAVGKLAADAPNPAAHIAELVAWGG